MSPEDWEVVRTKFRVDESGCWVWLRYLEPGKGYGRVTISGRRYKAHRAVYEHLIGPIEEGLYLDHLCRNRACVNPAHLEPVSNRENVLRGDTIPAKLAQRSHCSAGHLFDERNTHWRGTARVCRTCRQNRKSKVNLNF